MKSSIKTFVKNTINDERGSFFKAINGSEFDSFPSEIEVYFTEAKPNKSKGGHYHIKANEWFMLVRGCCVLVVVDVVTKERMTLKLDSRVKKTIHIPPLVAHEFFNTGDVDFLLMAVTDQSYRPEDTIAHKLSL